MIIKIEGYFFQNLITGHQCTQEELYQKYIQAKIITLNIRDLPDIFCRLHNFNRLRFEDDTEVGYVIDTDTDRIYRPIY
jgi:hypothetical protein